MSIVRSVTLGLALLAVSAAPALAGGYGGRYGAHYSGGSYEEAGGHSSGGSVEGSGYRGEEFAADGGYHAFGGAVRRTEETASSWRYRRIGDGGPGCWVADSARAEPWRGDDGGRHYDRNPGLPDCGPQEVALPGGFFYGDGGGVGGFPEVMGGGGGGGVVFAGAGARASASASASARVSISFRGRGGHKGGGHKGGGCGCGHGGKR